MLLAELGVWLRAEGLSLSLRRCADGWCASLGDVHLSLWTGYALDIENAVESARASYAMSKLEPLGPVHVHSQTGEEL
jgi:hypothetical protein